MCAIHISSVTGLEHYEAGIIASKCEQLSAKTETRAGRTLWWATVCVRGGTTEFNDIIFIPLPRKFIKICLLPDASKLNINEPSGK